VYCFDKNTHRPVWNKNVWKDFGGRGAPGWAVSQNPLVWEDLLILASQTKRAGLVAYEKLTGKVVWTSAVFPGRTGYVSPTMVSIEDRPHLVMISAGQDDYKPKPGTPGAVMGFDPRTGKRLWTYQGWQCKIPVANVTPIGDGRLFVAGGYKAGSAMIRVEGNEGRFRVTELYKTDEFGTHVHPPVFHENHLYVQYSNNERRDGLVCMDLDGHVKWKTGRKPRFDKGGAVLADGLLLSSDGSRKLYLVDLSPDGFKPLADAELLETRMSWAPLALSDGKLLIRDQEQMKCVAVR
jgi:outer membrane protein assembly factor BamB